MNVKYNYQNEKLDNIQKELVDIQDEKLDEV